MRKTLPILSLATIALVAACNRDGTSNSSEASQATVQPQAKAETPPAQANASSAVKVTQDNFVRAESDTYLAKIVSDAGGLGKLFKNRDVSPIEHQAVIRQNRDTLYSAAVFDLDAGPVTITLPDSEKRFLSMQVIDEDHYTHGVIYTPGPHVLTKEDIGTRYVLAAIRILVDPSNPKDLAQARQLQDAVTISQPSSGEFVIPNWDQASLKQVRDTLLEKAAKLPDTKGMFGTKDKVDPERHLIGTASAWGGNPEKEALYLNVTPAQNDGKTVYQLTVREVPVDGFWSISVYNSAGFYEKNDYNAYTINNLTAKRDDDGSVKVQFGGCDGMIPNCLPITPGWNYMVRLYRPKPEAIDGSWKFPDATARKG